MAEVKKVPGSVHLTAYYKGTWTQQITLEDSNGDPYSIAGATATFIIYELNGTAALTLSTGSGITHTGAGGVITVTATNAQIVGLATQDYLYELILTLADTTVMPVLDGTFSITEDGAAAASTADISVTIGGGAITLTLPIGIQGPVAGRTGGVLITPTSGSTAATGDSKAYFRVTEEMAGLTLQDVGASCSTSGSGATTIQVRRVRAGVSADMLSTPITIDSGETDSSTAAAPVIDASNDDIQPGDQIHFDLDAIGSGVLGVYVFFTFNT